MKSGIITLVLLICSCSLSTSQDFDPFTCSFKGKELYGKVQKVSFGADLKAEVVSYNADLEVDTTESWPDECGEWKFVESSADLKVEFVEYGADIRIRFVSYNPGVPDNRTSNSNAKINSYNCSYKGIPMYGKVKFVENFPDIKVKIVDSFEDIKVKMVENFPDDCGEWQVVENFEDFRVKIVESFEDIKVKVVDSFPGVR